MIITQEMDRTMLMDSKLTDIFWTHVVHTTFHIQNRVMLRNTNDKTPYELWKGSADNNLYIKVTQGNILLIEIYVNDIVLEVLMIGQARNLQRICRMNLKCHYLDNYPSLWVFRYVKATREFLFLKAGI